MKATTHPAIKCTLEYHRKEGVSEEAFTHWFTGQFLPRAVQIMKQHSILKYAVTDLKVGAALQAKMEIGQMPPGWEVNNCDVVLEYWVNDLDSIKSLAADPEWIQTALEGQRDWLNPSRSTFRIGYDTTYVEHAPLLNLNGAGQRRRGRVSAGFD